MCDIKQRKEVWLFGYFIWKDLFLFLSLWISTNQSRGDDRQGPVKKWRAAPSANLQPVEELSGAGREAGWARATGACNRVSLGNTIISA